MYSKQILLRGNREERIIQIFRLAGWYEGRSVDISKVEAHYREEKVPMVDSAKEFFHEYWGLARSWRIFEKTSVSSKNEGESLIFDFNLYPDEIDSVGEIVYDSYPVRSRQQLLIDEVAGETTTLVGEIGYYYPARLWIGNSGTLYALHFDYDQDKVYVFHAMVDFVNSELRMHEISAVASFE